MFSTEIINFLTIIFSLIIFYIFHIYRNEIANYCKLIDRPKKNKIHKNETALTGSFSIFVTLIISNIIYFINNDFNRDILLILLSTSVTFIIGLIDDRKNLSYKIKFIIFTILILIIINNSENLFLKHLNFETFNNIYVLSNFEANIVTLICLLLLINATNLSDGINGLCIGILIIWLLYIKYHFDTFLSLDSIIIISILTFIFIFKNYYFLGNSGSHFLGIFIGMIIIQSYNANLSIEQNENSISVEEIFILLMLPGLDMLRLFIFRLLRKQNPFSSDLTHLHHYLFKRYKLKIALLVYFSFMIGPLIIYNLTQIRSINIIAFFIIIYSTLIYFLNKKTCE